jgi:hypothetical protein
MNAFKSLLNIGFAKALVRKEKRTPILLTSAAHQKRYNIFSQFLGQLKMKCPLLGHQHQRSATRRKEIPQKWKTKVFR